MTRVILLDRSKAKIINRREYLENTNIKHIPLLNVEGSYIFADSILDLTVNKKYNNKLFQWLYEINIEPLNYKEHMNPAFAFRWVRDKEI